MFSFYPDLLYFKKNILISFVIQSYLIKYYWIFLFFKTRVNSNDVTLGFFFLRNVILGISRYLVVAVKRIYIAHLFSFERGFLSYKHKTYSNFLFQKASVLALLTTVYCKAISILSAFFTLQIFYTLF